MLLFLLACSDREVGYYNTPPAVSIIEPTDGTVAEAEALVEFYAQASDQQTALDALQVSWSSSLQGEFGTDAPDASGNIYLATAGLQSGEHVITLTVTDDGKRSAADSVNLVVEQGTDGTIESGPTVVLLSPVDGAEFLSSETVTVVATVTDNEDPYDALNVEILDVPDGLVWSGTPESTGSLSAPLTFSMGSHQLTLTATDSDGNVASASATFEILDDGRPTATITTPADGSTFYTTDTILFEGSVSDDQTDIELISVTWTSDLSGLLSTASANSSGVSSFATPLAEGTHTITMAAIDSEAKDGRDSVVITVVDPLNSDEDGDGMTENEGDCDDTNPQITPEATELCDEYDNDCDGAINEDWLDTYETNDTLDGGYSCGEVDDSFLWTSSTLTLSGLTLSQEIDEDWFYWGADDEWYDNIGINVSVTGLPASGTYVVELYNTDTGNIEDSDSGSGTLTISYDGDLFSTDEDNWAVRVYASSWPAGSCSTPYTLNISS